MHLSLSVIKPSQVVFMVKFSPTALNFGYDFVLLVHFLGHPLSIIKVHQLNGGTTECPIAPAACASTASDISSYTEIHDCSSPFEQ